MAQGQPPQRARTACSSFPSAAATWKKTSARTSSRALQLAKERGSAIIGIVGRDGGYTATVADVAIVIATVNPENTTPHAEAFQAVVWHLFVSHPQLKVAQTKWESTKMNAALARASSSIATA